MHFFLLYNPIEMHRHVLYCVRFRSSKILSHFSTDGLIFFLLRGDNIIINTKKLKDWHFELVLLPRELTL